MKNETPDAAYLSGHADGANLTRRVVVKEKDAAIKDLVMICRRLARMADPDKRANGLSADEIVLHAYRIADEAGVDARPSPLRAEYTEGADRE